MDFSENYEGSNTGNILKPVHLSEHALLKYKYKGYLGKHNQPNYPAESYIFQCLFGIVHFHISLN